MAVTDKSTARVIAVIALLALAMVALRGYVPGVERVAEREPPRSNPAALAVVITMLSAAVVVIGLAVLLRMRDPRARGAPSGTLPRGSGRTGRPTWRFTVIALAAVIAWVLLVSLLSRLLGPFESSPPDQAPPPASAEVAPPSTDRTAERPAEPDSGTNVVAYLVPPMVVLMVVVVVGAAVVSRRQRRTSPQDWADDDVPTAAAAPVGSDTLARAAEVGLAEIGDRSREPREAIIACYAAMERELTRVPGAMPQAFDTPSEVLARAVDNRALKADSATELVDLFEEARFSPHVMTEAHRDAAVQVLRRVLDELPQGSNA